MAILIGIFLLSVWIAGYNRTHVNTNVKRRASHPTIKL